MKIRVLLLGAVLCALIAGAFLTFMVFDRGAQGQAKAPRKYSEVPQIISNVNDLEIVQSNLRDAGTTDAAVRIEIKNRSGKPIIAVAIESGDEKDASGINLNGIHDGELAPSIVVQPDETFKVDFPLANVRPGFPIRIGGVVYADGTEDGDEKTLKSMRGQKEYRRNKRTEDSPQ